MSTTVLGIRVNADTNGAVTGLNNLNRTLGQTDQAVGSAGTTVQNFSRVISDAPFGIIGVANNIEPLIQSFTQLKAQTGSTGGAFKALLGQLAGGGGLMLGVSLLTSALTVLSMNGFFKSAEAADEAAKAAENYKKAIDSIFEGQAREATEVGSLIAVLKSETETRERKLATIKELQRIQPDVFDGLRMEKNEVIGLDGAYQNYLNNLRTVIAVKIKQQRLEGLITELLKEQGVAAANAFEEALTPQASANAFEQQAKEFEKGGSALGAATLRGFSRGMQRSAGTRQGVLQAQINALLADIQALSKGVEVPEIKTPEVRVKPDKVKLTEPKEFDWDILIRILERETGLKAKDVGKSFFQRVAEGFKAKDQADRAAIEMMNAVSEAMGGLGGKLKPVEFPFKPVLLTDQNIIAAEAEAKKFGEFMNGVVLDSFVQLGENIGTALGEGGNFFSGFLRILGAGIRQIGVYLVTTAKLIEKIKNSLFSKPALAIGLGVGLIAFGSLISAAGRSRSVPGFAKGVNNFRGGLALVGEQGPELVRLPTGSDVIPNNRIGDMSGTVNNTFGVQDIVIDGYKLRIVLDRANQSYNRNF